jgi:hypothetical protein
MATNLVLIVAGSLLCISALGPSTQDRPDDMARVLAAGDSETEAFAKHRLTAENLRQMFAIERELLTLMKESPDVETRATELARRIDPERRLGTVLVTVKMYEGTPEIARILQKHRMSAREYMLTRGVAMVTAMTDSNMTPEVMRHEGWKEIPPVFMTPALKFWRSMDPALKTEADEWAKAHGYDKGINR